MRNICIWSIQVTLIGTSASDQSKSRIIAKEVIVHTQELEPHHQMQFYVIPMTQVILDTNRQSTRSLPKKWLHILKSFRTGASPPDAVLCHTHDSGYIRHEQTVYKIIARDFSSHWVPHTAGLVPN